jgi:hypothetical protein
VEAYDTPQTPWSNDTQKRKIRNEKRKQKERGKGEGRKGGEGNGKEAKN